MPTDLLVLAGNASELLEQHGLIACGRRENGATRVDFWTRTGKTYRYDLTNENVTVAEIVATCLAMAGVAEAATADRNSSLLS
jgi:hypothetical protein